MNPGFNEIQLSRQSFSNGAISGRFQPYFDEMEKCLEADAYRALLHIVVCLPDLCAGLESPRGNSSRKMYISWCDRYLKSGLMVGEERHALRCMVVHRGRVELSKSGRYLGFMVKTPRCEAASDNRRGQEGLILTLDVRVLADEMRAGIERWVCQLESNPSAQHAKNAYRNLRASLWNDPMAAGEMSAYPPPTGSSIRSPTAGATQRLALSPGMPVPSVE